MRVSRRVGTQNGHSSGCTIKYCARCESYVYAMYCVAAPAIFY
jgi:hypothetical protein